MFLRALFILFQEVAPNRARNGTDPRNPCKHKAFLNQNWPSMGTEPIQLLSYKKDLILSLLVSPRSGRRSVFSHINRSQRWSSASGGGPKWEWANFDIILHGPYLSQDCKKYKIQHSNISISPETRSSLKRFPVSRIQTGFSPCEDFLLAWNPKANHCIFAPDSKL